MRYGLLVSGLCLCLACSFDYGGEMAKELDTETANQILIGFKQTSVVDNKATAQFVAETAELFDKRQEARLTNLGFTEFGANGQKNTEGKADLAVIQIEKKDAQVSGQVSVYSLSEKTRVFAENLTWSNADKTLYSPPAEAVTIERDTGSSIQGKGFIANLKVGSLSFTGGIKGTMVDKEKTETPPTVPVLPKLDLPSVPPLTNPDQPGDPNAQLP